MLFADLLSLHLVTFLMFVILVSAYYSVFDLCGFCSFSILGVSPNGTLHRHISMKGRYKATIHIHCSFRTPQLPETVVTTIQYLIQSITLPEKPALRLDLSTTYRM